MCELVPIGLPPHASPELRAMFEETNIQPFEHRDGNRVLTVVLSIDHFSLDEAYLRFFGIQRWRHVSVGVRGSLQARVEDQKRIGRKRGPGERSPAPLPDWYDLTHLAYEHPELGFDPKFAVWQYLPPQDEPYLNIAEALHLRQPA